MSTNNDPRRATTRIRGQDCTSSNNTTTEKSICGCPERCQHPASVAPEAESQHDLLCTLLANCWFDATELWRRDASPALFELSANLYVAARLAHQLYAAAEEREGGDAA